MLSLAAGVQALGCASDPGVPESSIKNGPADLGSGKADGSLETVGMGPIDFDAVPTPVDLAPGFIHEYSFALGDGATVEIATATPDTETPIDTVLRLTDEEGGLIALEDDTSGIAPGSAIIQELEAGRYRVTVTLYADSDGTWTAEGGSYTLVATCGGAGCGTEPEPPEEPIEPELDPWEDARDPDLARVYFTEEDPIPESYTRADAGFVSLSSPEWWQRWPDGHTQSFNWAVGTDYGKRCAQASAIRLEAIWNTEDGRAAFESLRDGTGWSRTMYNWIEDLSQSSRGGGSAQMWAWRTGALKWINIVHADGSCSLPTTGLVERFSATCRAQAERSGDGNIQGCRAN